LRTSRDNQWFVEELKKIIQKLYKSLAKKKFSKFSKSIVSKNFISILKII